MGEVLCNVNWISVLSDAMSPQPSGNAHMMVVYLLYLMVFLAKEDHLISKPVSVHIHVIVFSHIMKNHPLKFAYRQSFLFFWGGGLVGWLVRVSIHTAIHYLEPSTFLF